MLQFPQLEAADLDHVRDILAAVLGKTGATAALLVEKAGYLIVSAGQLDQYDPTQLAALSANAYAATQYIASLVGETDFNCMFQQGDRMSVLWRQVDETSLLILVFPAAAGVGLVRYHANTVADLLARQLTIARERNPRLSLDLSDLNPRDVQDVFRRR